MSYLWTYFYGFSIRHAPSGFSQELCFEARTRDQKGTLEALTGRSIYFEYWNTCCKIHFCEVAEPGVLRACIARPDGFQGNDPIPGDGRYKVF